MRLPRVRPHQAARLCCHGRRCAGAAAGARDTALALCLGAPACVRDGGPTASRATPAHAADALVAVLEDMAAQDFDQVIVAHGDVVAPPRGKAAFQAGALDFYRGVAARRREGGASNKRAALAACAALALGAAVLAAWRR